MKMTANAHQRRRFVVVWEFRGPLRKRRAFEKAYGPDGALAKLFRDADGYLGTELLRDRQTPGRYLTIDQWKSRQAFLRFKKENRVEYHSLDNECAALTEEETKQGEFEGWERP
jgi:heme-degrading monooxygenase HmoA